LVIYREIDILAWQHIHTGQLTVDTDGAIYRPSGQRAERLHTPTGYGRVYLAADTYAWAHRIVWMATYGLLAAHTLITHINKRGWDNRILNLQTQYKRVRVGTLIFYPSTTQPEQMLPIG
jgi:hypothetical protein